jgi:hypothetical protein
VRRGGSKVRIAYFKILRLKDPKVRVGVRARVRVKVRVEVRMSQSNLYKTSKSGRVG